MLDTISTSVKNILRKRMRSMLTIIGISIGVLSVVVILMISDMGKIAVNRELSSMGIGGVSIRASNGGSTVQLGEEELRLIQQNSVVAQATPLMTSVSYVSVRSKSSQCVLWGVDSNAADIVSLELLYGRMINSLDVSSKERVCIVDESFALQRYKRRNIVGKKIDIVLNGKNQKFEVIGVVSSGGNLLQGLMGEIVPTFVYAPFTTLSRLTNDKGFTQIVAKLNDKQDEISAVNSISRDLSAAVGESHTIKVENLNRQKEKLNGVLDAVTLVLAAIGGISLIVSGLSIMTVMLVTVNERTREIGIKKSIGASRKIIMLEFLTEALILSLLGSIIGAAAGIAVGGIGSLIVGIPLSVNLEGIAFCIVFCAVIGVLFGVYPAIKASKLKPVEALRFE